MSLTTTDANGNVTFITDPSGNEITPQGKTIAGILLILVTVFTALALIAHWPDKMPPANTDASTKYQYKWFHVTYCGVNGRANEDTTLKTGSNFTKKIPPAVAAKKDSPVVAANNGDTQVISANNNNSNAAKADTSKAKPGATNTCVKNGCTIDLNTLILLLVAIAGFLGNIIHIASSFTNFVGAGKFKRSWMLWYFVKPFTASALAVGVYIIFRAGFLNSGEATVSVNLYGVVAIAILAGLYTDMATLKLKEVFAVIFQSSTTRPNPLDHPPIKITSSFPSPFPLNEEKDLIISGSGFDNRTIKIKVNDQDIENPVIQANSISFKYTATTANPVIFLLDEKGAEIGKFEIKTAAAGGTPPLPPITATGISPANITVNTPAPITIAGTGLDTAGLTVTANGTAIADGDITKSPTSLVFNYTAAAAGDIAFVVSDDKGNQLGAFTVTAA